MIKCPYWVCNVCRKPIATVKAGWHAAHEEHKKTCEEATYSIKQLPQGTKVTS
jgi:hypothetical protein